MGKISIVPEGHNKSVYFVLPLLGLNRLSFGKEVNFFNSYISYNGKVIVIVKEKDKAGDYTTHPEYLTDFDVAITEESEGTAIIYSFPKDFEPDMEKFINGKYSIFSDRAKEEIRKLSTLDYRMPISGSVQVTTDKLLLVLDKHEALRAWIEKKLKITISTEAELLDKPDYDLEFMDVDTVII